MTIKYIRPNVRNYMKLPISLLSEKTINYRNRMSEMTLNYTETNVRNDFKLSYPETAATTINYRNVRMDKHRWKS